MALKTIAAIAAAQARTAGAKPRVHPNGFIQLDLESDGTRIAKSRLHVWPDGDDIPKQETATTIHDHRFDMRSTIVSGYIVQRVYDVSLTPYKFTHEIHVAQYPTPKESVLGPSGVKVHAVTMARYSYHEGDSYTQRMYTFHDTDWVGLTATLMSKGDEDLTHTPRVLVPVGQTPDNDFVRADCDEDLLWDYIERALS